MVTVREAGSVGLGAACRPAPGEGVRGAEEGFCSPEKWEGTASGLGQKSQVLALDPMTFIQIKRC